jgi:hypothetical protein
VKRLLAALVLVAAASPALGCKQSDASRTDRIDIEGVDCIVVRDGAGRIQRTDCNWSGAEPKGGDQ